MAEEKKQQNVEAEKSSNDKEKFCTNCWTWINVENDPDHPQHCSKDR